MLNRITLHRGMLLARLVFDSPGLFEQLYHLPWYGGMLEEWCLSLSLKPGQSILEIGCGPGLLCRHLALQGNAVTGWDSSRRMVQRAKSWTIPGMSIERRRLVPGSTDLKDFDAVIAASVLNVADDPFVMLHQMAQLCRAGGTVSALFPLPVFSDRAASLVRSMGLTDFSAAAMLQWAHSARSLDCRHVSGLFRQIGLENVTEQLFLDGSVAAVQGTIPK